MSRISGVTQRAFTGRFLGTVSVSWSRERISRLEYITFRRQPENLFSLYPNLPIQHPFLETQKMNNNPLRVIIRVCVTDIPAQPVERVYRLGRDFSQQILRREFNNDLQAECHDAMHFLPRFDSEDAVKAWFMYDFNVTSSLSKEEVRTIPHEVYHATRQGDSW